MKNPTNIAGTESRALRHKRMVAEMSNWRTLMWVGVALLLHVVVIFGTSIGYMKEHWFTKSTEHQMTAEETQESSAAPAANTAAKTAAKPATPASAGKPAPNASSAAAPLPAGLSDDDKKMAERSSSPTIKNITATAKPGELPKGPQRSAFDIDDSPK